jgi:hypothetical protein
MSDGAGISVLDFVPYAKYGTVGVILAALVVSAILIGLLKRRPSDREILMVLGFLTVAILIAFGTDFVKPNGPWIFVGTVQNITKLVHPDNSISYAYSKQDDDNSTIEYVFYVSHTEIKEGTNLHLPLIEPQPGQATHVARFCFTKEPTSYSEVVQDNGDVWWEPNGPSRPATCAPPNPKTGALNIVSSALAAPAPERIAQAEPQTSNFTYTTSDVPGLCRWQSRTPAIVGQTFVICDPSVLSAPEPGPQELKVYVTALQEERTDAGTKTSVLKRLLDLSGAQQQILNQISSPQAFFCDDQQAYPDQDYKEPLALTLLDQARSTDSLIKTVAGQAIQKLQAEAQFADFLARGKPECRGPWVLRLELLQAQRVVGMLGSHGVPAAEISALDVQTPDQMRTIIRPQATPNGDLYRVQAPIPADDATLMCLAKVYRLVNIQDEAAGVADPAQAIQKEFALLKARFAGKTRSVGWYSKIFQRDLLYGTHQCKVQAYVPS